MVWHPDRYAGRDSAKKQKAHERTRQLVAAYAAIREHFRTARAAPAPASQASPVPQPIPVPKPAPGPRPHTHLAEGSILDQWWMAVGISVVLGGLADLLISLFVTGIGRHVSP